MLASITEKVDRTTDRLGNPIDEGIRETVVMLQAFGFRTTASCEGHPGEERGTDTPWVDVKPEEPQQEAWQKDPAQLAKVLREMHESVRKLTALLDEFYRERRVPYDSLLTNRRIGYGFRIESIGAEILHLFAEEERAAMARNYRSEMDDFTNFLQERFYRRELVG